MRPSRFFFPFMARTFHLFIRFICYFYFIGHWICFILLLIPTAVLWCLSGWMGGAGGPVHFPGVRTLGLTAPLRSCRLAMGELVLGGLSLLYFPGLLPYGAFMVPLLRALASVCRLPPCLLVLSSAPNFGMDRVARRPISRHVCLMPRQTFGSILLRGGGRGRGASGSIMATPLA